MIPYEKMIGIVFHSFSLVNKQQKSTFHVKIWLNLPIV